VHLICNIELNNLTRRGNDLTHESIYGEYIHLKVNVGAVSKGIFEEQLVIYSYKKLALVPSLVKRHYV
jgi:hypothetical protein